MEKKFENTFYLRDHFVSAVFHDEIWKKSSALGEQHGHEWEGHEGHAGHGGKGASSMGAVVWCAPCLVTVIIQKINVLKIRCGVTANMTAFRGSSRFDSSYRTLFFRVPCTFVSVSPHLTKLVALFYCLITTFPLDWKWGLRRRQCINSQACSLWLNSLATVDT
jgi:hypothetical protein